MPCGERFSCPQTDLTHSSAIRDNCAFKRAEARAVPGRGEAEGAQRVSIRRESPERSAAPFATFGSPGGRVCRNH